MTGKPRALREPGSVKGLFLFALLAGFCLLSMLVVVVGARVYQSIGETVESNHNARTSLSYLAGKVRSSDGTDAVNVFNSEGASVLTLDSRFGDSRYTTYIFYRDGGIREYFAPAERPFQPDSGDVIVEARDFSAALNGDLLTLAVTDPSGKPHFLSLCLSCGKEAGA